MAGTTDLLKPLATQKFSDVETLPEKSVPLRSDARLMNRKYKRHEIITFIAYGMVLATTLSLFYMGFEKDFLPLKWLEEFCYFGFLLGALGIYTLKEWGRKLTVMALSVYFGGILYIINYRIGPQFKRFVEQLAGNFQLSELLVECVFIPLIVVILLWPIFVILFLTHPKVKIMFNPKALALLNEEE